MYSDETLDPIPLPKAVENDMDNKAVRSALKLIQKNYSAKSKRDVINRTLKNMIENGFVVAEPKGPRKLSMKKLYEAWWKIMQKVKLLDFTIHGSGRPEWMEKIVTDGVSTILRKGGYVAMFRDKGGLFQNGFGYGYAFGWFGTRKANKGFPFKFQALSNDNVYVDARATSMRSGSKPVKEALVITSMTWADYVTTYPEFEDVTTPGRIPRDNNIAELDQDEVQAWADDNMIEVGYYYSTIHKYFVQFAGKECTIIDELSDKDYPYTFHDSDAGEDTPYIPVIHFACLPSFEGFYDHGIFDSIYDLSVIYGQILNMQTNYTMEGVDPVKFFSVPKGQGGKVIEQMDSWMKMRSQGKTPFAVVEYDPSTSAGSGISAQSMQVQSLMNEAQILFDQIDKEVRRMGWDVDDMDLSGTGPTQYQILADEDNRTRPVIQVMEQNASEQEFIIKVVLDLIPELIKPAKGEIDLGTDGQPMMGQDGKPKMKTIPGDTTPLQMTTKVHIPDGDQINSVKTDEFTLGDLALELKNFDYFVKINEKSGADQSKLRGAQISRVLQVTPPGTKAYFDLLSQFAQINDMDQDITSFGAGQPQPGAPGQPPMPVDNAKADAMALQ